MESRECTVCKCSLLAFKEDWLDSASQRIAASRSSSFLFQMLPPFWAISEARKWNRSRACAKAALVGGRSSWWHPVGGKFSSYLNVMTVTFKNISCHSLNCKAMEGRLSSNKHPRCICADLSHACPGCLPRMHWSWYFPCTGACASLFSRLWGRCYEGGIGGQVWHEVTQDS